MLNKKDPLVNAIQQIMQNNQVERNAVNSVNEKFGITDRKALPHERQGEWDVAYQSLLKEELHPNQKKLDLNKNKKLDRQDFKMIRSMKEQYMPKTDPYAEGQASSISVVKPKEKSVTPADQNALTNKIKSVVKEAAMSSDDKKKARMKAILKNRFGAPGKESVAQSRRQDLEEKITKSTSAGEVISDFVDSENPKFEGKSKKERMKMALGAYYSKHPEKSNKVAEGFNNRHNSSVNASVKEQVVADLNEKASPAVIAADKKRNPRKGEMLGNIAQSIIPGMDAAERIGKGDYTGAAKSAATDVALTAVGGPIVKGAVKAYNYFRRGKTTASVGQKLLPKSRVSPAAKTTTTATSTAPKSTQTYANAADELSDTAKDRMSKYLDRRMGGGSSSASTKPAGTTATQTTTTAITKAKPVSRQYQVADAAPKRVTIKPKVKATVKPIGGATKQSAKLDAAPRVNSAANTSAWAREAAAKRIQSAKARTGSNPTTVTSGTSQVGSAALRARQSSQALGGFGRLASAVRNNPKVAAATGGAVATTAAAIALKNKPESATAKPAPSSPITASTGPQARMGGNPTAEPRSRGTMARKIEAQPRDVSAKEIMGARYKEAVKSVGGESGARKIQPGTNVAGVGPIAKGETIYGNIKKQLSRTAVPGFERGNTQGGAGR